MAQLPPKIPTMLPVWADFSPEHKLHSLAAAIPPSSSAAHNSNNNNPSWVDEFLDFSSTRRRTHRRSVSDSIAFLEAPMLDDCRATPPACPANSNHHNNQQQQHDFDKFDDEQFTSMFSDDISSNPVTGPNNSSSNPSTPSDHNSFNDEKEAMHHNNNNIIRCEADDAQSPCNSDSQQTTTTGDRTVDPKRVKRILANRQSAQRSRVRKLQYISELERSVTSLQAEVSVLSPRVAFLDHQRLLLNVDNSALKQRIAALAQDKIFKDAHQEALKREIERLRQVYHQQNLKKIEISSNDDNSASQHKNHNSEQPSNNNNIAAAEKEQQLLQV
ncbi:unnamed protein product [Linum trigynum]|uniref:BZIP domain-containing protein n=1 Tax=Linum trigynum TaxID=586398 RepID=A0AAV2EVS1_9ROSI